MGIGRVGWKKFFPSSFFFEDEAYIKSSGSSSYRVTLPTHTCETIAGSLMVERQKELNHSVLQWRPYSYVLIAGTEGPVQVLSMQ